MASKKTGAKVTRHGGANVASNRTRSAPTAARKAQPSTIPPFPSVVPRAASWRGNGTASAPAAGTGSKSARRATTRISSAGRGATVPAAGRQTYARTSVPVVSVAKLRARGHGGY
jgi:hypothetical protein